jgi:hypothetical protein
MTPKECEVHFKDAGTFLVTWDPDPARPGWRLFRGPIRALEADPSPVRLGRAVGEALERPAPPPGFRGDFPGAALRAVGLRGWTTLERSSRSFHVADDGERVTVRARPVDSEGSFPIPELADATCPREVEKIGRTLLDLRPRCPLSAPPTPPRPGRSYQPRADATCDPNGWMLPTFGYKFSWFVIDTADAAAVVAALGLKAVVRPASWDIDPYGVDGVFVSPSVLGWTFVLGLHLWPESPDFVPLLERLSCRFGEVQAYASHRVVDLHAWAKAVNGEVVRAYGWIGERGELSIDLGELTPEERELGFNRLLGSRTVEGDWGDLTTPDEQDVMRIAGKWSLNPQELDAYDGEGPGFVGRMP